MSSYTRLSLFIFITLIPELALSQVYGVWTLCSYDTDTTYTISIGQHYPKLLAQWRTSTITFANGDCVRYTIDLRLASDSSLFQSIIDTSESNVSPSIEFVDIDRDGLLDIKLAAQAYLPGGESYHFWTFDKKRHRFAFDAEFSQLCDDLAIDSLKRTITQTSRLQNSPPCKDETTFSIINHRLKAIQHVWQEQVVSDTNGLKVRTYTEKLIKGKMKLVKVFESD